MILIANIDKVVTPHTYVYHDISAQNMIDLNDLFDMKSIIRANGYFNDQKKFFSNSKFIRLKLSCIELNLNDKIKIFIK